MQELKSIARLMRSRGVQRTSITLLFERLRWINVVETSGDIYRLNNNHRPWYAREIMQDPEFAGLFVTRESATDPDFYTRTVR